MRKGLLAPKFANEWSQSCCKGFLFASAAYLIVVYFGLPLFAWMMLGSWLWPLPSIQLSSLSFALLCGLLWGTTNFVLARLR